MLTFLQIRNYAIVETLDLEFEPGFTCISGETGAGKSILVGALGLLCGRRADSGAVRSGADRAELSAGFELPADSTALAWLASAELNDGSHCLLRRVVAASGRSRAWINGTAVTLGQLAELGARLVEIHGQNEHIRLLQAAEQFQLLDGAGDHPAELAAVADRFARWQELTAERSALLAEPALDAGDADLLNYQVRELEESIIPVEAFHDLEREQRRLAQGHELLAALQGALDALGPDGDGAGGRVASAVAELEPHGGLDDDIAAAVSMLREASINCDEAMASLQSARARLDLSPERLQEVERQLRLQHDLARKHRVEPEQLMETLERLRARLERAGTLDRRLEALEREIGDVLSAYTQAARALHAGRQKRAAMLSQKITRLLQELGMEGGRFDFKVTFDPDSAPAARGSDRIELRVSTNPGLEPAPLAKVASGGELSRISLAVRVAARSGPPAATQVFDEVDAGIGGETAHAVGALLRSLSSGGQALCVTHLAQVAAFADQQLKVMKNTGEDRPQIKAGPLADEERIDEIARMLGGQLSEQSRAHAQELLLTAQTRH